MANDRGDYTWDLFVDYHRCPSCGFIIENRKRYELEGKDYTVHLKCPRCNTTFTNIKKKSSARTLLGEEQTAEIDWS